MKKKQPPDIEAQTSKPIRLTVPASLQTTHATHVIFQTRGTELNFFFFEVEAPLFIGTTEEQLASYQELPDIPARCVARVVMSMDNLQESVLEFIKNLSKE